MAAAAGVDILEGADQLVHAPEQALLPVARRPGAAMVHPHLGGQLPALGEVDQPDAHSLVVVDDENAGANDLVVGEEGGLLDDEAHVLQSLQQLLLHRSPGGQELFDGLGNLVAAPAGLQILNRRTSAQAQGLDPEALGLGRGERLPEGHVAQLGDGLRLVLRLRGSCWVHGHHLLVEIRTQGGVAHLRLEESAAAHLDVHHARIPIAGEQVL